MSGVLKIPVVKIQIYSFPSGKGPDDTLHFGEYNKFIDQTNHNHCNVNKP